MGNFYTNITLRGPEQPDIIAACRTVRYQAFVTRTTSGLTLVCEKESDTQNEAAWHRAAKTLSAKLACPAFAVLNHDDDILRYALYRAGDLIDEYDSDPSYFAGGGDPPSGGRASSLCELFGMPGDAAEVERVLRPQAQPGGGRENQFLFACDRHEALLKALDWPELPEFAWQMGYNYLTQDGPSEDWTAADSPG